MTVSSVTQTRCLTHTRQLTLLCNLMWCEQIRHMRTARAMLLMMTMRMTMMTRRSAISSSRKGNSIQIVTTDSAPTPSPAFCDETISHFHVNSDARCIRFIAQLQHYYALNGINPVWFYNAAFINVPDYVYAHKLSVFSPCIDSSNTCSITMLTLTDVEHTT